MKIIDDTYNGKKYPIIEREYNAYYFPDNYDPDNIEAQSEAVIDAQDVNERVKIFGKTDCK